MMNPFEYRDIMKASFGYTDETPEQVQSRYEAARKKNDRKAAPRAKKGTRAPAEPSNAVPQKAELEKLAQLLAGGRQNPQPVAE